MSSEYQNIINEQMRLPDQQEEDGGSWVDDSVYDDNTDGAGWSGVIGGGSACDDDDGCDDDGENDNKDDLVLSAGDWHIPDHACNLQIPTKWKSNDNFLLSKKCDQRS